MKRQVDDASTFVIHVYSWGEKVVNFVFEEENTYKT